MIKEAVCLQEPPTFLSFFPPPLSSSGQKQAPQTHACPENLGSSHRPSDSLGNAQKSSEKPGREPGGSQTGRRPRRLPFAFEDEQDVSLFEHRWEAASQRSSPSSAVVSTSTRLAWPIPQPPRSSLHHLLRLRDSPQVPPLLLGQPSPLSRQPHPLAGAPGLHRQVCRSSSAWVSLSGSSCCDRDDVALKDFAQYSPPQPPEAAFLGDCGGYSLSGHLPGGRTREGRMPEVCVTLGGGRECGSVTAGCTQMYISYREGRGCPTGTDCPGDLGRHPCSSGTLLTT